VASYEVESVCAVDALLAARQMLYCYFRYAFGAEPQAGFDDILCDTSVVQVFALFADDECSERFRLAVDAWDAARSADTAAFVEACATERMSRLVGPGHLDAYPWESVWTEGSPVLFRPVTAQVAQAYAACGYRFQSSGNAPADHLSAELDFMSRLAEDTLRAFDGCGHPAVCSGGSANAVAFTAATTDATAVAAASLRLVTAQQDFLDRHLLSWAVRYLAAVEGADADGFLAPCACALRAFLQADQRFLKEFRVGAEAYASGEGTR
jgi:TorA maturation chaperone TorD